MTIETTGDGGFTVTGPHVQLYQMMAIKGVLALERKGISMGAKGRQARKCAREVYGCDGRTGKSLLEQMEVKITDFLAGLPTSTETSDES